MQIEPRAGLDDGLPSAITLARASLCLYAYRNHHDTTKRQQAGDDGVTLKSPGTYTFIIPVVKLNDSNTGREYRDLLGSDVCINWIIYFRSKW